jgi:prolipoprotein diacylglyceryltransferase
VGAIIVPFDPVAVRLGPLVLTWHGLFSALGIFPGLYVAAWLAHLGGHQPTEEQSQGLV